jgi:hypothetical protein
MFMRDLLAGLAGSEGNLEVLIDITGGSFRNGEAAESHKVADGTMTRTRQKAEALVEATFTAWRKLDDLLSRIAAEIRDLPRKALKHLHDVQIDSPDEYKQLCKKHKKLYKAMERLRDAQPAPRVECERVCKLYEKLYKELGKLKAAEIGGVDLSEVGRLEGEALHQIDAIRSSWLQLTRLLNQLDPSEIRDVNLNELRRLTDDGLGLVVVAQARFQKIVELLGKGKS